jgi:hypothetical protein
MREVGRVTSGGKHQYANLPKYCIMLTEHGNAEWRVRGWGVILAEKVVALAM